MNEILMNQKFMLVFDLDGTLLSSKQTILKNTKAMLNYLSSKGHIITLASGRPSRSIKKYMDDLNLQAPYICYNGSMIENPFDPSFKPYKKMISKDIIIDLLSHFPLEIFANIITEDETDQYYLKENQAFTYFFHPEEMRVHIGNLKENLKKDMMTLVIEVKDESSWDDIKDYLNKKYDDISLRVWLDAPRFGELFFYNVNKATSIAHLANLYNIDRSHIICFGDAMNDAPMMKYAGISFAMKNGAEELKRLSTYVTKEDHDNDGIYYALKEFFQIDEI